VVYVCHGCSAGASFIIIERQGRLANPFIVFAQDMNMHLSELADTVLSQWEYTGSVIKVTDSDDVFGMITVLNLHQHKVWVAAFVFVGWAVANAHLVQHT
jgi:hypothetical protein